jgi:hypothetical protein
MCPSFPAGCGLGRHKPSQPSRMEDHGERHCEHWHHDQRERADKLVRRVELPGVGRVEGIKRQDGQWVVVTARGLITSAP